MNKYYSSANTVISIAGAITFEEAVRLTDKYFANKFKNQTSEKIVRAKARPSKTNEMHRFKDIEQVHMCLGFPSQKFNSKNSSEIALLNIVLGGGMSSRLFQKIREEKGLCYTIYSYPSAYRNSGMFTIYSAVNPKSVKSAGELIISEIKRFVKDGITKEEFNRGKEQIKSGLIFGQESSSSIMNAYGRFMTITGKMLNLEKKLKSINAMTLDGVNEVLKNLFDFNKISGSYVGREDSYVNIYELKDTP